MAALHSDECEFLFNEDYDFDFDGKLDDFDILMLQYVSVDLSNDAFRDCKFNMLKNSFFETLDRVCIENKIDYKQHKNTIFYEYINSLQPNELFYYINIVSFITSFANLVVAKRIEKKK